MSDSAGGQIRPARSVIWTEVDSVVFLCDSAAPEPFVVHALEGTAATIWRSLQDAPTEEALVSRIADEYGVDAIEVTPELRRFLTDLRVRGLVTGEG